MSRAEWSAWTQAIGAIVALLVAVGIAWHQAWATRQDQLKHADLLVRGGLGALEHHIAMLRKLTAKQPVSVDSKFLRDAIQPFNGILGVALPQEALARVFSTRQLLLTLANDVDDWQGRTVESCKDFKHELDGAETLMRHLRDTKWKSPL